jgi:hypothetical protein
MRIIMNLLLLSFLGGGAYAQSVQPLFHIERTKNANKLYYEANIKADGTIDREDPVRAYWIMWAKDPSGKTTESMNFIERTKVYGFNVKPDSSGRTFMMTLKPFRERLIRVYMRGDSARAEMVIDGRPSYFQRMLIYSKGDSKPDSIRLFGRDLETGARQVELFLPGNK